jgi:hypothetical protein
MIKKSLQISEKEKDIMSALSCSDEALTPWLS